MSTPTTDPLLVDLPMPIETARLSMRPPRTGDGPPLHDAIRESLAALREFLASLPWIAAEPSVAGAESYCRSAQANFVARKDMPLLIFDRAAHALIGATGLHRPDWSVPKAEVGYWVRTSRAGAGYITEAVDALAGYAFAQLGLARLEIITDEANAPSRRVAERCGFALEGVLRNERRAPDGALRNTCVYARLA